CTPVSSRNSSSAILRPSPRPISPSSPLSPPRSTPARASRRPAPPAPPPPPQPPAPGKPPEGTDSCDETLSHHRRPPRHHRDPLSRPILPLPARRRPPARSQRGDARPRRLLHPPRWAQL